MGGFIRRFRIIRAGFDGRGLFSREKRDRRIQFQDCRIDQSIWSRVFESNKIARTNRDSLGTRKYSHHGKASARRMGIDSGNGTIARYVFTRLALVRVQEVRPGEVEIQSAAGAAHSKR